MKYLIIPKGIQILFTYIIWILVLAVMTILDITYGNTLSGQILRILLLISMFIGIGYMLIFIVSILYVAKCPKNTEYNPVSNFNKKSYVCYRIALANWCRNIAYGLAEMEYSKSCEGYASHPQNDSYNKQKPFH